ncbi:MAG: hypothetical protein AAF950_14620 [Pseudomonadota bacterium]
MRDTTEIFVPMLAHKLKALFSYAEQRPELGLPKNKSELGRRLNAYFGSEKNWSKIFNQVASAEIERHEEKKGPDGLRNGKKLTLAEHRAILDIFKQDWPNLSYWDDMGRDRDRNEKRFKRSLLSDQNKILMRPVRRNQEFAKDEIFTLEVEDVSTAQAFTGRIFANPLDHRLKGEPGTDGCDPPDVLDMKLRGKTVGTVGFQEFHIHVEGDETAELEARSQNRVIENTTPAVEVAMRVAKESPSWLVRLQTDNGAVICGRFAAADFDLSDIQPGGIVDVCATCIKPHFCISQTLADGILDAEETATTLLRYQKIAEAKVEETFDSFEKDSRRLTLARVSLTREA